ncbi:MAG: caspase family protein [Hyphomicrobiaceae bacterium]
MNRVLVLAALAIQCIFTPSQAAGRFSGEVSATWLANGRDMELTAPISYLDSKGVDWSVPKGTIVDGASIPRALWSVVGSPFTGKYRKASVVHDYYCQTMKRPWKEVHQTFYEAAMTEGNSSTHSKLLYAAVYTWGPRWDYIDGKPVRTRDIVRQPTEKETVEFLDWLAKGDRLLDEIEKRSDTLFPRKSNASEKRVALVIGNSAYQFTAKLQNPSNDAADVSATLRAFGYHVIEGHDLDKSGMEKVIRAFARELGDAAVGLLFYAGHGLQVGGQNFLIPIDAKLEDASGLEFETIRLDLIQRAMERDAKTNVIFLDACRDNPLARNLARTIGTRGGVIGRGLATVESGVGTLISFSTQPGNVALDGTGRNSPFTSALVRHMTRSANSEDISSLLISVRNDVIAETKNRQIPWEHSALRARFFFPINTQRDQVENIPLQNFPTYEQHAELTFWNTVKDSHDKASLLAYIERYPTGTFISLARVYLERIEEKASAAHKVVVGAVPNSNVSASDSLAASQTLPPPDQSRQLQLELKRVGCYQGPIDGTWGEKSRSALDAFKRYAKVQEIDRPIYEHLAEIKSRNARVCPLVCDGDEQENEGKCVAKARPSSKATTQSAVRSSEPTTTPAKSPERTSQQRAFEGGTCTGWLFPGQSCIDAGGRTCTNKPGSGQVTCYKFVNQ